MFKQDTTDDSKDNDSYAKRAKWSADTFATYADEEYVTGKGSPATDASKFYKKKIEKPLDFMIELSSNKRINGQKDDEPDLSIDERVFVASIKTATNNAVQAATTLGVGIGAATMAAAPEIATAVGIATGALISVELALPAAAFAGVAAVGAGIGLIIGSPLVSLKYEEWIVEPIMNFEFKPFIDDRTEEEKIKARENKSSNIDLAILRGYQRLKGDVKQFNLNSDLPVYLKGDTGELKLSGVLRRSASNQLRFFTDENIKKDIVKPYLGFQSDLFTEKKISKPAKESAEEFRKKISEFSAKETNSQEENQKEYEILESILFESLDPKEVQSYLTQEDKKYLNEIHDKTTRIFSERLTKKVENFVNNVNQIIDHSAFEESYKQDFKQDSEDMIPLMHTAFSIFSFVDPEKAMLTKGILQHSGQLLSGGIKISELLVSKGLSALTTAQFSLGTDLFLSGLSGLIGLFSKTRDPNEPLYAMLRGISQQITRLHEDMIENFRQISIALGLVHWDVVKGFEKLEVISRQQHKENMDMLVGIKKILYINTIYLEEIKKALLRLEEYHIFQQISDADWHADVQKVKNDCTLAGFEKSNPSSKLTQMAFNTLRQGIETLYTALIRVQTDSITRANRVSQTDYAAFATQLGIANANLASGSSRSFSENLKLGIEQNIHLLAKYLRDLPFKKEFPKDEDLFNPAALFDITKTIYELMSTYRKSFGYIGLPENPVTQSFKSLIGGINAFEDFMNSLSDKNVVEHLFNDYTDELQKFSTYITDYQHYGALDHFYSNVKDKLINHVDNDLISLTAMNSAKTSDFFTMSGRDPNTGHGWFEYLWSHEYGTRWSAAGWNEPSCHEKGDRPCWVPTSEIEKAKQIYKNSHQVRAQNIYNELIAYQTSKKSTLDANFKAEIPVRKIRDFIFYSNQTLNYWQSIPYYFRSGDKCDNPLLVPTWYLDKIPNAVFNILNLGAGTLKAHQWTAAKDGYLHFSLNWEYSADFLFREFVLFEHRTAQVLPGYKPDEALTRESVHYAWFGGYLPKGTCQEFDPDLNRISTVSDAQAIKDYNVHKNATYDCAPGSCHAGYRATICMPDTTPITGLFPNTASFQQSPQSTIDILNQWPVTKSISDAELSEINNFLRQEQQKIRKRIMSELRSYLNTGAEQATQESKLPKHLQEDLVLSFNRLSVKAKVLKMVLSLVIPPYELNIDPSWPNIFDGNDILRELSEYKGQGLYLNDLLEKNHQSLLKIKPEILKIIQIKKTEHYPFLHIKQWFESYILDIAKEIVPTFVAQSKPEDMYQLKEFVSMLTDMEKMHPGIFDTIRQINPEMAKTALLLDPSLSNLLLTDKEEAIKQKNTEEEIEIPVYPANEETYYTGRKLQSISFEEELQTSSASSMKPRVFEAFHQVVSWSFSAIELFYRATLRSIDALSSTEKKAMKVEDSFSAIGVPEVSYRLEGSKLWDHVFSSEETSKVHSRILSKEESGGYESGSYFNREDQFSSLGSQSLNESLIVSQYLLHYAKEYSPLTLPWNKMKDLRTEDIKTLKERQDIIKKLKEKLDFHQKRNIQGINRDIYEDASYLINKTNNMIEEVLVKEQSSNSVLESIGYNIERIRGWIKNIELDQGQMVSSSEENFRSKQFISHYDLFAKREATNNQNQLPVYCEKDNCLKLISK